MPPAFDRSAFCSPDTLLLDFPNHLDLFPDAPSHLPARPPSTFLLFSSLSALKLLTWTDAAVFPSGPRPPKASHSLRFWRGNTATRRHVNQTRADASLRLPSSPKKYGEHRARLLESSCGLTARACEIVWVDYIWGNRRAHQPAHQWVASGQYTPSRWI